MLALFLFVTITLQLYAPIILGQFIDQARANTPVEELYRAAFTFIGLIIVAQMLSVTTTYQAEIVGWNATNALRLDLTSHILKLDLSFHHQYSAGELIERVDGDVGTLHQFFAQFVVRIVGNAFLLSGLLAVLYWNDVGVGIGITIFVVFVGAILFRIRHLAVEAIIKDREIITKLGGFWEERLLATIDLRSNGATDYVLNQQQPLLWQQLQQTRRARSLGWAVHASYIALHIMGYALVFALGGALYLRGQISLGTFYLIFHYLGLVVQNLRAFVREMDTLQRARASLVRIEALLAQQSQLKQDCVTTKEAAANNLVEFTNVSFAYDEQPVLQELSFTLRQGEHLALVGRTGSGKSTIARLLFRFYDPQNGEIKLDGVSLRQLPLLETRKRVGMVTQTVELFNASVRDNITFFDNTIADEKLLATVAELGLSDWLERLPAGLDTPLGNDGAGLSAGEAQLLALARLFIQDPQLVILDEASARLDPVSEELIDHALQRLLTDRSAIIIAHRLKTIRHVNSVIILENGRLLEQGSYESLRQEPKSRLNSFLQTIEGSH